MKATPAATNCGQFLKQRPDIKQKKHENCHNVVGLRRGVERMVMVAESAVVADVVAVEVAVLGVKL